MFSIGDTVYMGQRRGKITGLAWPGSAPVDGVVALDAKPKQRPNSEAVACFVTFTGRRGPVRVDKGDISRVMALPVRVTTKAG